MSMRAYTCCLLAAYMAQGGQAFGAAAETGDINNQACDPSMAECPVQAGAGKVEDEEAETTGLSVQLLQHRYALQQADSEGGDDEEDEDEELEEGDEPEQTKADLVTPPVLAEYTTRDNSTLKDGVPGDWTVFQSSGKCEQVNSLDECKSFAAAIGAPGGTVGVSRRRKSPTGCYQFRNAVARRRTANNLKVYYASGDVDCTSTRTCMCKPQGMTFSTTTKCPYPMGVEACNAIAVALGAPTGRVTVTNRKNVPPGCYQYHSTNANNLKVYYAAGNNNYVMAGQGECSSTRTCICSPPGTY